MASAEAPPFFCFFRQTQGDEEVWSSGGEVDDFSSVHVNEKELLLVSFFFILFY